MAQETQPVDSPAPGQGDAAADQETDLPLPGTADHEHPSELVYIKVALVLAVITAIEVGVYYIQSIKDSLLVPILLVASLLKFVLVVLFFMHLRYDSPIFRRLFVTGLILAIGVYMIVLTTLHVWSR
jgi:cytochrome c oxidase subunit 4